MMQLFVVDGLQCGVFLYWVDGSDDLMLMVGDNVLNVIVGFYKFGVIDFDLVLVVCLMKQLVFDLLSVCNDCVSVLGFVNFLMVYYLLQSDDGYLLLVIIECVLSDCLVVVFLQVLFVSVLNVLLVGVMVDNIGMLYMCVLWWCNIFDYLNKVIVVCNVLLVGVVFGMLGVFVLGLFYELMELNYFWFFVQDWFVLIDVIGGKQVVVVWLNKLFVIMMLYLMVLIFGSLNGGELLNGFYIGNELLFQLLWGYNWVG